MIAINGFRFNTYTPTQKSRQQPSFEAKAPIDLNYVLKERSHLLPPRILEEVKRIVSSKPEKLPTLKEVHQRIYAPLLECKTLEEAQKTFSEFEGVKEATVSFERITGNIKKLKEGGFLEEGFSLKILQELWANLKSQDEIAKGLGLKDRNAITWVLQKIGFVNYDTNYKTLLMASSPDTRAIISGKTLAWNASHPDLVRARNKKAAQGMKKPENREAHSRRMKQHFIDHPERREQVSENSTRYWSDPQHREEQSQRGKDYAKAHPEKGKKSSERGKAAWALIPEARMILKNFFRDYTAEDKILAARLKDVFSKRQRGIPLTGYEEMILSRYNKACAEAHPEIGKMISDAHKMLDDTM